MGRRLWQRQGHQSWLHELPDFHAGRKTQRQRDRGRHPLASGSQQEHCVHASDVQRVSYACASSGKLATWDQHLQQRDFCREQNGGVDATFDVGKQPENMAFDSRGNLWVTNAGSNTVSEIKGSSEPCKDGDAASND